MYDYREAMTEDVKQWITDEVNLADWTEDRGGLEQSQQSTRKPIPQNG